MFDFGGVIVDIDRDKAVQAFIKLGLADADTRLDKYHQTGIFQELEEGKLSADEFRKQLGDLCGRELTMEETKQAWLGFFNEVDLRKLDYILGLRKSYHVYLLSNTNPFVMSWACSPEFSSEGKPLNDYCDKLYLSYQLGHTKPAPEIFDFIIQSRLRYPTVRLAAQLVNRRSVHHGPLVLVTAPLKTPTPTIDRDFIVLSEKTPDFGCKSTVKISCQQGILIIKSYQKCYLVLSNQK